MSSTKYCKECECDRSVSDFYIAHRNDKITYTTLCKTHSNLKRKLNYSNQPKNYKAKGFKKLDQETQNQILQAIKEKRIDHDCQLLVRIHPLYYTYKEMDYIHKNLLDMFNNLQDHFPELIINRPVISSEIMNYSMPKEEIDLLASILKHIL